ncbi:MAG TPA: hypothetical protein VJ022_08990 [Anaerolineales bacterium]|nr:hypothetical protein [Anaerolineales bacterium]
MNLNLMKRYHLLLASFLGLVAGCASPSTNPIPTPYPPEYLPTVIALTADSASISSTETAVVSIPNILPSITANPKITTTPLATASATTIPGHAVAAVQITSPGPMSKVVSPITLKMNIITGESKSVQIDLYGEDGRLLSRNFKKGVPTSREGVPQTIKIPFEIRAAAELGRITISTFDDAGRTQSLNSVRVLLLSSGLNEITTPGNPSEPFRVISPLLKGSATGGVLSVKGDMWPFNLQSVILELIDPEGKVIGLRVLAVENIDPQLFDTTIPYKISEPTLARLTIRQDDDRIPGLFYLYSQEILLNP